MLMDWQQISLLETFLTLSLVAGACHVDTYTFCRLPCTYLNNIYYMESGKMHIPCVI